MVSSYPTGRYSYQGREYTSSLALPGSPAPLPAPLTHSSNHHSRGQAAVSQLRGYADGSLGLKCPSSPSTSKFMKIVFRSHFLQATFPTPPLPAYPHPPAPLPTPSITACSVLLRICSCCSVVVIYPL